MRIKFALTSALFSVAFMTTSCSFLAGDLKPKISVAKSEIKKFKKTGPVVLTPLLVKDDKTGNADKGVLAAAVSAFGSRARPTTALKPILNQMGGGALADLITLQHQVAFTKAVKKWEENSFKAAKSPKSLKIPRGAFAELKINDPAALIKQVQSSMKSLQGFAAAVQSGDQKKISKAANENRSIMAVVNKISNWTYDKLDTKYMLINQVKGTAKDWNAKKQIRLISGLVNIETGKLRFVAQVAAKKGTIPTPYELQLPLMMNAILDSVGQKDPSLALQLPQAPTENTDGMAMPTAIVEE